MKPDTSVPESVPHPAWHLLLLTVAMAMPTVATWIYFVVFDGQDEARWIYSGSKVVQFSLPVWLLLTESVGIREMFASGWPLPGEGHRRRWSVGFGTIFGFVVALAACGLYFGWLAETALFVSVGDQIRVKLDDMGVATPGRFIALAAFLSVLHSGLEEYYWRWFVCGQLGRRVPMAVAIVLSSLGFMAHHVIVLGVFFHWDLLATSFFSFCIAFGGAVWAWLYLHTRSLTGAWISHLLVDAAIMVIGYHLAFS